MNELFDYIEIKIIIKKCSTHTFCYTIIGIKDIIMRFFFLTYFTSNLCQLLKCYPLVNSNNQLVMSKRYI